MDIRLEQRQMTKPVKAKAVHNDGSLQRYLLSRQKLTRG